MQKILTRRDGNIDASNAADLVTLFGEVGSRARVDYRILEAIFWRPEWFSPELTLTRPDNGHGSTGHGVGDYGECADCLAGTVCFVNNIVRLQAGHRTAAWRVLRYHHDDCRTWEMAWPD